MKCKRCRIQLVKIDTFGEPIHEAEAEEYSEQTPSLKIPWQNKNKKIGYTFISKKVFVFECSDILVLLVYIPIIIFSYCIKMVCYLLQREF